MIIKTTAQVAAVEERFEMVLTDPDAYGGARAETTASEATAKRSLGWFIKIEGWSMSLGVGPEKPDFAVGDTLSIELRRVRAW